MLIPSVAQPIPDGWVTVDGSVYRALIAEDEPEVDPRQTLVVSDRDVRLRWDGKALQIRSVWRLVPKERTWLDLPIAGPQVRVDRVLLGGVLAKLRVEGGYTRITAQIDRPVELVLEGAVEGDPTRGPLSIPLAGAVRGQVEIAVPQGLEGRLIGSTAGVPVRGTWLTTSDQLSLQVGPPQRKARDRSTLAVASVGMGLTVGDGAVDGRAQVRWALRQGRMEQVVLRVDGVGNDLEVTGGNVGRVERQGSRVVVTLREPSETVVDLEVRWSVPVPTGESGQVAVPRITPEGAFRTEASLQLARDGTLEVLPEVPGWQAISASELPDWGDDLVAGTPTAAYRSATAGKGGTLGLLRFVPASGPAVVVDVASLTIATSYEGRTLTRALYTVRNERGAHLAVTPPAGSTIVGVRVNDGPVTPVADGGRWLVPLPRSLETVDGLVSFPVEVVLLGDGTPWIRKEGREIPMPVVDAPIAVNRVTLHLPPTYENDLDEGAAGQVDEFTEGEGIAYGFGLGDEDEAQADQLWQDAQAAWMRNDFDEADELLDELEVMGASNENLGKLRSNLDVVQGRDATKAKTIQARRVREQAKSRGLEDYRKQEELLRQAEEELSSGQYGSAQATYEEVAELAQKLDKLEQEESFEQKATVDLAMRNSSAASQGQVRMAELSGKDEKKKAVEKKERDRVLDRLAEQADRSGWVTTAADSGNVADGNGIVTEAANGRLDGDPSFIPVEGQKGEITEIADEIEAEIEAERRLTKEFLERVPSGRSYQGALGGVAGGVVGGEVGGADGLAGLGTTGVGRGGGGSAETVTISKDEIQHMPEPSPDVVEEASVDFATSRRTIKTLQRRSGPRGVDLGGIGTGRRKKPKAPKGSGARDMDQGSYDVDIADEEEPVIQFGRDMPLDDDGELSEIVVDAPPAAPTTGSFSSADMDFEDAPIEGNLATPDAYKLEALEVTSTRMSVVIPVQGETLRYEHLLLPAGAEHAVRIEARSTHRDIPRRLP